MGNHHIKGFFITLAICFITIYPGRSQTAKQVFSNTGIWQDYGMPLNAKNYKEFNGRLVNVNWSEIETAPNKWDWSVFDSDINQHIADNMPVIILVYTGMNAPNWIFSNGVPKVIETASDGSTDTYSPYYLDDDYNVYFKRMVTTVRQHIQTLSSSVRSKIIGIQACFGSTGDQIAYKGTVPDKYAITTEQFDSLFKVYSTYYYNEYKNLTPKISLLSNPSYGDSVQLYWLLKNCPGGWIKCGTFAKGSQLNFELEKNSWLYDVMNKPSSSEYVQARCEVMGSQLTSGWWTKNQYKEMFAIMCYCIYWGLDWPNETSDFIQNSKYDSAFAFFNKYAGQKVAGTATNALCALKDALDASDSERFPASQYGTTDRYNTTRYKNIYNSFSAYGAKLEDISVVTGSEYSSLSASGTNDVGWRLLPGNYERFLHQINPNATSAGYWNIDDEHKDVMYGRFGRGFDIANNKNALYFDVEDNFFRNKPLNSAYPITVEITYYDDGKGSWQLYYDAKSTSNKLAATITCTNSGTWKKRTITLSDAYFDNRSTKGADFYIKNAGSENVIFSTVELSRKEQSDEGLITTALEPFDSVCVNTETTTAKSFVINGASLNGTPILVGPLNGFKFSTSGTGAFANSLTFSDYGSAINTTVYVKQNTVTTGDFSGNIPVSGGGSASVSVKAISVISNTNPALDAALSLVSCTNKKDGAIDLKPQNGKRPFKYQWTNDIQKFWSDTTEDISDLQPGTYTVVVNSGPGCSTSKAYRITQPEPLSMSVSADSAIKCNGGTTTVSVTATGGTKPYTGTGIFTVGNGFRNYPVSDANGCSVQQGLSVPNGTKSAPSKPDGINGPTLVSILQANLGYSVKNPNSSYKYTWTVPDGASIVSGQYTKSITVLWGLTAGNVTVKASNDCGESGMISQKVSIRSGLTNGGVSNAMVANNVAISNNESNKEMVLLPNPVTTVGTLSFHADKSYTYNFKITDVKGRVLMAKNGMASPGTNLVKFDASQFAAGVYLIGLLNNNGEYKTVRLIKQ
jgi:hypothetical protein